MNLPTSMRHHHFWRLDVEEINPTFTCLRCGNQRWDLGNGSWVYENGSFSGTRRAPRCVPRCTAKGAKGRCENPAVEGKNVCAFGDCLGRA